MECPLYVLKTSESDWAPTPNARQVLFVKRAVRTIVLVLLLGSIFFQGNLFDELSLASQALLIALLLGTCFLKDKQRVAKPIEIQFYPEYLVILRENRYYSPTFRRKEIDKFLYKDIREIVYRADVHRLNIYGVVEGIWYNYNKKDGSLPETPSYHKTTDSISYFYTNEAPEVDFVGIFEQYTGVKVNIIQ